MAAAAGANSAAIVRSCSCFGSCSSGWWLTATRPRPVAPAQRLLLQELCASVHIISVMFALLPREEGKERKGKGNGRMLWWWKCLCVLKVHRSSGIGSGSRCQQQPTHRQHWASSTTSPVLCQLRLLSACQAATAAATAGAAVRLQTTTSWLLRLLLLLWWPPSASTDHQRGRRREEAATAAAAAAAAHRSRGESQRGER